MSLPLVSIRRYPVKAMGGEYPTDAALDERGIVGDRWFAVHDADGFLSTGKNGRRFRRHDEVFDHGAITEDGVVWVHCEDGRWPVGAPGLDAHLSDCMGLPVSIQPETATLHQDRGHGVSLVGTASLAWCREHYGMDADPRRLRVNLVVATDEPFIEESWAGTDLQIGTAVLHVAERITRCRMIDVPQDGAGAEDGWLKRLAADRQMTMGIYLDVLQPGRITSTDGVVIRP